MKTHQLKCWPRYFNAVSKGDKMFELRLNDRGFVVGDRLELMEYDPELDRYSGYVVEVDVTWVVDDYEGLKPGYICMGINRASSTYLREEYLELQADADGSSSDKGRQ